MDTPHAHPDAPRPRVIWVITDGRRGHERQTEGLAQALGDVMPVTVHRIPRLSSGAAMFALLRKQFPPAAGLPAPDLILGAGHGTHLSLLAAHHAYGGRTVVLMKPSLPLRCFDLCVIPEHDGVGEKAGVFLTLGALNTVRRSVQKTADTLILVGGPSTHYHWDEAGILEQIAMLCDHKDPIRWTLTTSPRTPKTFLPALRRAALPALEIVPVSEVDTQWLPARLAQAEQVWVTPDSVAMVYESLTAGARVGIFDLQAKPASRVVRGIARLLEDRRIQAFGAWQQGHPFLPQEEDFNEAKRCAQWIRAQWFPES